MRIVLVGGGAAGMFASLLLARAGYEVVVLEQDRLESAPDVEAAAASAFRPTAPQIVQPHIVMAKSRALLLERLPDLYQGWLDAGVIEVPVATQMPPTLADTEAWPGDEDLTILMTRRSTIDWVLLRAVLTEPGVTLRCGVRAIGLLAVPGKPPHVTGVRTDQGDFGADLVVDASGRRSPLDRWLRTIGAQPTARRWAECGVSYFSRHYRVHPRAELPGPLTTRIVQGLDEFTVIICGADNGAMQLVVVPLAADRRFRTLNDPAVFTAMLRTMPTFAAWLDVMDPISPVYAMGALHNTMRRLVVDAAPVATGLQAIGDSVSATNPTLGRGVSLALSGAVDLRDTVAKHGDDWIAQALAMDRLVAEHVVPFYEDQVAIDAGRLAVLRHAIFDIPAPDRPHARSDRVTFAQLGTAAQFDPTAFRALWRVMGMIGQPEEVYTDPLVVHRTRQVLLNRERHADAARKELVALEPADDPGRGGAVALSRVERAAT